MNTALFSGLGKYQSLGLLLMRLGLGTAFILYGYPKISGGSEMWKGIGGAMGHLGVTAYPMAWGFAAACAEFGGGILLILGLFFRPATLLLLAVMTVATVHHWAAGDAINVMLHPIELASVFLGLFFVGPGRYSIDGK